MGWEPLLVYAEQSTLDVISSLCVLDVQYNTTQLYRQVTNAQGMCYGTKHTHTHTHTSHTQQQQNNNNNQNCNSKNVKVGQ